MITLKAHIDQQHGGNVTAFAKSVGRSRPLAYRWLRDGAVWLNGRVFDPVTAPTTITDAVVVEQDDEFMRYVCPECTEDQPAVIECCECGTPGVIKNES